MVVDPHQLVVVVHVVGIVKGILGVDLDAVLAGNVLLVDALHEGVAVPQPLAVAPHVVDNGTGNAPLGTVMVDVGFPESVGQIALQAALEAHGIDVAVLPGGRGVVGYLARGGDPLVAELVFAARAGPLAVEGHAHTLAKFVFKQHRGVDQVERPGLERGLQVRLLARLELGPTGREVDGTGRTELAGRLEYLALLSVIKRNLLDILERELAQVHLAVLGVAQLNAVVVDPHVVGAHAADIDGFQTAHAAVILDLQTREIAYGIGHREAVERLQLLAR